MRQLSGCEGAAKSWLLGALQGIACSHQWLRAHVGAQSSDMRAGGRVLCGALLTPNSKAQGLHKQRRTELRVPVRH